MTQFWSVLIAALVEFISSKFPVPFADFFKKLFFEQAKNEPDPEFLVVGVAPDDLKSKLREAINAFVSKSLASRPVIHGLAKRLIAMLPDTWLDTIWDSMLDKLTPSVAAKLPPRQTSVTDAKELNNVCASIGTSIPFQIDEMDLSMAKVEAGIE